jgi:hypothetical protein
MTNPSAGESLPDVDASLGQEPGRLARQLETETLSGLTSTQIAAGLSLVVGLLLAIMGAGHLHGVLTVATSRGYDYDFRLAGLLLVGSTLVYGGVLCLSSVRGLTRGRPTAWVRAMSGTLLLLLVLVLMIPVQPSMAPGLSVLAAVNLIALLGARRRLEPAPRRE